MKICVLSGGYPARKYFLSTENHRIYCSHHGYTYINSNWPTTSNNRYLNKIYFLQHYLDLFDYIFWLDDDAFFLDTSKSLEDFIPKGDNILSICQSPNNKPLKTIFSSGSFMISCAKGKEFVQSILETDLQIVRQWWKPEYGFFTNGDQDIMVYLYLTDSRFKSRIEIFDHNTFNSRLQDIEEGTPIFLLHFTGPLSDKKKTYRKTQLSLGLNKSLIPTQALNGYNIIDTNSLRYKLVNAAYRLKGFLSPRSLFKTK